MDTENPIQTVLSAKIDVLGLSVRAYNSLRRAGVDTLEQAINLGEDGVLAIRGLSRLQQDEVFDSLARYLGVTRNQLSNPETLLEYIVSEEETDLIVNSEACDSNIAQIAEYSAPSASNSRRNIIEVVPGCLPNPVDYIVPLTKAILESSTKQDATDPPGSRDFDIIRRRFGLQQSREYTLQEIGYYYNLTRERVRQLEARAIARVRESILGRRQDPVWQVPAELVTEANSLMEILMSTADVLVESEVIAVIESRYASTFLANRIPDLRFMMGVYEFRPLPKSLVGLNREIAIGWIIHARCKPQQLFDVALSTQRVVNSSAGHISLFDLIIQLNKRKKNKIERHCVELAAKILVDVEKVGDGYQIKFEYLSSLADQAHRVLTEHNKPLYLRELVREINRRRVSRGLQANTSLRSLGNQLASDQRFKPIGRSGQWSLAEWEDIHHKTIVELMEEFFHVRQTGGTAREIYEYVSERRVGVSEKSVISYLAMLDKFIRVDKNKYELSSWNNRTKIRRHMVRRDVQTALDSAVVELFQDAPNRSMPLRDIIRVLHERTSIPESTLYLNISKTTLLRIEPDPEHKRRRFVTYVGQSESSEAKRVRSNSVRNLVDREVRQYLQRQPNRKAPLAQIYVYVEKTIGCGKPTFYHYLADMAAAGIVRKDYEGGQLVCFLETEDASSVPLTFPQVEQISDAVLKEQLERAVKDLTVENVDLGLFQLGRIFENELKAFLIEAQRRGSYVVSSKDLVRLASMIDCVERNGIVKEKHHLTLLREQRNERAHGDMPDIEERRRLMQHSPFWGDLYIKYIRFFNEKKAALQ